MLETMRRDQEIQRALQHSKRANGMLIKAEAEELQVVDALVQQLLQNEYRCGKLIVLRGFEEASLRCAEWLALGCRYPEHV